MASQEDLLKLIINVVGEGKLKSLAETLDKVAKKGSKVKGTKVELDTNKIAQQQQNLNKGQVKANADLEKSLKSVGLAEKYHAQQNKKLMDAAYESQDIIAKGGEKAQEEEDRIARALAGAQDASFKAQKALKGLGAAQGAAAAQAGVLADKQENLRKATEHYISTGTKLGANADETRDAYVKMMNAEDELRSEHLKSGLALGDLSRANGKLEGSMKTVANAHERLINDATLETKAQNNLHTLLGNMDAQRKQNTESIIGTKLAMQDTSKVMSEAGRAQQIVAKATADKYKELELATKNADKAEEGRLKRGEKLLKDNEKARESAVRRTAQLQKLSDSALESEITKAEKSKGAVDKLADAHFKAKVATAALTTSYGELTANQQLLANSEAKVTQLAQEKIRVYEQFGASSAKALAIDQDLERAETQLSTARLSAKNALQNFTEANTKASQAARNLSKAHEQAVEIAPTYTEAHQKSAVALSQLTKNQEEAKLAAVNLRNEESLSGKVLSESGKATTEAQKAGALYAKNMDARQAAAEKLRASMAKQVDAQTYLTNADQKAIIAHNNLDKAQREAYDSSEALGKAQRLYSAESKEVGDAYTRASIASRNLAAAHRESKTALSELATAQRTASKVGAEFAGVYEKSGSLMYRTSSELQEARNEMAKLSDAAHGAAATQRLLGQVQLNTGELTKNLSNGLRDQEKALRLVDSGARSAKMSIFEINNGGKEGVSMFSRLSGAMSKFGSFGGTVFGGVTTALRGVGTAGSMAVSGIGKLASVAGSAVSGTAGLAGSFGRIATQATLVGGAVGAIGTVAAGAIGVKAVSSTMQFSQAINMIRAVVDKTEKDSVSKLADAALAIGANSQVSAIEAAQGFEEMAKAGFKVQEILDSQNALINLHIAGEMDMADATQILAGTIRGFGLKATDANHVMDVLAQTAAQSAVSLEDIGYTFKYVAPLAGATKYTLEDLGIAVGIMGNNMIKGSQAGTTLRNIISRLANPPKTAQTALDGLNVSLHNQKGELKGFIPLMEEFRTKFSKMSEVDKLTNAEQLAGKYGMSGFLALMNATEDDWNNMKKEIYTDSKDVGQKMADEVSKGWSGSFARLKAATTNIGIYFGKGIEDAGGRVLRGISNLEARATPAIRTFAANLNKSANSMMDRLGYLDYSIQNFRKGIKGTFQDSATINPFARFAGQMGQAVQPLARFGTILKNAFADYKKTTGVNLSFNDVGIKKFADWVANDLTPSLYKAIPTILHFADAFSPMKTAYAVFQGFMNGGASGAGSALVGRFKDMGAAIKDVAEPAISHLVNGLTGLSDWIGNHAYDITKGLGKWTGEFVDWAGGLAGKLGLSLATTVNKIANVIVADAPQIAAKLGSWTTKFVEWGAQVGSLVIGGLAKSLTAILEQIGNHSGEVMGQLGKWTTSFVEWAASVGGPLLNALGGVISGALDSIGNHAPEIVAKLGQWTNSFLQWAGQLGGKLFDSLKNALNGIGKALGWGDQMKTFTDGADSLVKSWGDAIRAISDFVTKSGIVPAVLTVVGKAFSLVGDVISFVAKLISDHMADIERAVKIAGDTIGKILDTVKTAFDNLKGPIKGIVDALAPFSGTITQMAIDLGGLALAMAGVGKVAGGMKFVGEVMNALAGDAASAKAAGFAGKLKTLGQAIVLLGPAYAAWEFANIATGGAVRNTADQLVFMIGHIKELNDVLYQSKFTDYTMQQLDAAAKGYVEQGNASKELQVITKKLNSTEEDYYNSAVKRYQEAAQSSKDFNTSTKFTTDGLKIMGDKVVDAQGNLAGYTKDLDMAQTRTVEYGGKTAVLTGQLTHYEGSLYKVKFTTEEMVNATQTANAYMQKQADILHNQVAQSADYYHRKLVQINEEEDKHQGKQTGSALKYAGDMAAAAAFQYNSLQNAIDGVNRANDALNEKLNNANSQIANAQSMIHQYGLKFGDSKVTIDGTAMSIEEAGQKFQHLAEIQKAGGPAAYQAGVDMGKYRDVLIATYGQGIVPLIDYLYKYVGVQQETTNQVNQSTKENADNKESQDKIVAAQNDRNSSTGELNKILQTHGAVVEDVTGKTVNGYSNVKGATDKATNAVGTYNKTSPKDKNAQTNFQDVANTMGDANHKLGEWNQAVVNPKQLIVTALDAVVSGLQAAVGALNTWNNTPLNVKTANATINTVTVFGGASGPTGGAVGGGYGSPTTHSPGPGGGPVRRANSAGGGMSRAMGMTSDLAGLIKGTDVAAPLAEAAQQAKTVEVNVSGLKTQIDSIVALFKSLDSKALEAAASQAESVGKIASAASAMADVFTKIKEYVSIGKEAMTNFVGDTVEMVTQFMAGAGQFNAKALEGAATYFDSVNKIGSAASAMADALAKLRNYVAVGKESIDLFNQDVLAMAQDFVASAKTFAIEDLGAANSFADTASKMADATGKMADSLKKVVAWGGLARESISGFVGNVKDLVYDFWFYSQVFTEDMYKAGTAFSDTAGKVADTVGKMADSMAKIRDWAGLARESMTGFTGNVKDLVYDFWYYSQIFTKEMYQGANDLADTGGKVADTVSKMAEAMNKVRDWGGLARESIRGFTGNLKDLVFDFADYGAIFTADMLAHAQSLADTGSKVADTVLKGVEGLNKIRDYKPLAEGVIHGFVGDLDTLVRNFSDYGAAYDEKMRTAATTFADVAGKAADAIVKGADGFDKIKNYKGNIQGKITSFVGDLKFTVDEFVRQMGQVNEGVMTAVKLFSETGGTAAESIGKAVEGFKALANYGGAPRQAIINMVADIKYMLDELERQTGDIDEARSTKVKAFGDAVQSLFSGISQAMEVFEKLKDFKGVATEAMAAVVEGIRQAVNQAGNLKEAADTELLDKVKAFGEATSQLFSGISQAMEVFDKLKDLKDIPAGGMDALIGMITTTINKAAALNNDTNNDLMGKADEFVTHANDVFDKLKGAIDKIASLESYKDELPKGLDAVIEAARQAVTKMGQAVGYAQQVLIEAETYEKNMEEAAAAVNRGNAAFNSTPQTGGTSTASSLPFNLGSKGGSNIGFALKNSLTGSKGNAASALPPNASVDDINKYVEAFAKVIDTVKNAADVFTALSTYSGLARKNIDQLQSDMDYAVQVILNLAGKLRAGAVAAAGAWSEDIGKIFSGIKNGLDFFVGLKDYTAPAMGSLDGFKSDLSNIVSYLYEISKGFNPETTAMAAAWGEWVGKLLSGVKSGLDLFSGLETYVGVGPGILEDFMNDVKTTVDLAVQFTADIENDMLTKVSSFGNANENLFKGLSEAMGLFNNLPFFESMDRAQAQSFFDQIGTVYGMVDRLAAGIDPSKLDKLATFSEKMGSIFTRLGDILDFMNKLADLPGDPTSLINEFINSIKVAIESGLGSGTTISVSPSAPRSIGADSALFYGSSPSQSSGQPEPQVIYVEAPAPSQGATGDTYEININVYGNSSPEETARAVKNQLNQAMSRAARRATIKGNQ